MFKYIDLFFVLQVWYQGVDPNTTSSMSATDDVACVVIFISAIIFLILPIFCNIFQLHSEIKDWLRDVDTRHIVEPFIDAHLRALYLISLICGSSFSAIELCHSHLFGLKVFDMGLNSRQRSIFKNKRIFSIVALES